MTAFLYPITVPACRKYMFHMIIMVRRRDTNQRINTLFYIMKIIKKFGYTPKQPPILSKSKFFRGVLWYFCQAVKYGLIVTPVITRRLVGWRLPPLFQPSDIAFRTAFVCIGSAGHASTQKKRIYTKKHKNRLLPCYQWLKALSVMAFMVTRHISLPCYRLLPPLFFKRNHLNIKG